MIDIDDEGYILEERIQEEKPRNLRPKNPLAKSRPYTPPINKSNEVQKKDESLQTREWPRTPLPGETTVNEGLQKAVDSMEEDHIRRSGSQGNIKNVKFSNCSPRKRPMSAPILKVKPKKNDSDDFSQDVASDDGSKDTLSNASD